MKKNNSYFKSLFLLIPVLLLNIVKLNAGNILIGTTSVDITPELPVALTGQFNLRIAEAIETPLTANIIAFESQEETGESDAAIMVSCDLLYISNEMLQKVREEVGKKVIGLNINKIFLSATHTHTAPVLENDSTFSFRYKIPEKECFKLMNMFVFLSNK